MAYNFTNPSALVPDSPAIKRQRTTNGYNSTSTSANNTNAFNSDNEEGDDLFADYIPDTPSNSRYETQPTQLIDRNATPLQQQSSPSASAPRSVIQVPASSPLQQTASSPFRPIHHNGASSAAPSGQKFPPPRNTGMSMAPAGTMFRPPPVVPVKPKPVYVIEDDGPTYKGGSSDEDDSGMNIKPSTFLPKSAQSSFGSNSGNARFKSIVGNASYKPATQLKPERPKPVVDLSLDSFKDQAVRDKIMRVRAVYPHVTVIEARDALMMWGGSVDEACLHLASGPEPPTVPQVISDDELGPTPVKKSQPEMKRGLVAPIAAIRDRYSSTQQAPRPQAAATPPPKPKRKLMQGRRHPSSPAIPIFSSPLKQRAASPVISIHDDESDSGVASASEEDPELGGRVLKYINTCTQSELIELTNITAANAALMIGARPFRNLDIARTVANPALLKGGKKSARAPIGDKIVDTAMDMFSGYEAIDQLVTKCEQIGKPLADEMGKWGFDVFGAARGGELEMTSFEDDADSLRDSGIGSPSSRAVSDAGDDDVKATSSTRKKAPIVNFLKKPAMMADDCILKDYQVVGLNWLALMYRHKLSGILADEMGLGKTCQVIALLSHLVETGQRGPHLIIVPGSTLENWLREFPKFSPDLVVEPYYGAQKERAEMADSILARRDDLNVIVTTYDLAAKKEDNKFMRRLQPDVSSLHQPHTYSCTNCS